MPIHAVVVVISLVVSSVMGVIAAIAVWSGRVVLPWHRNRVHPRIWGSGALLVSVALGAAPIVPLCVFSAILLPGMAVLAISGMRRFADGKPPDTGINAPR